MKKGYVFVFFMAWLLTGCEQNITLDLPKYDDKVAVFCILVPGVKTQLYLNLSKSYYEYGDTTGGDRFIKNASVAITNTTDNVRDTFKLDSIHSFEYFYTGKYDVKPGKHYVLEVRYKGKVINAETTVPYPAEIDRYTFKKVIDTSGFSYNHFDFDIFFKDRKGEADMYQLDSDNSNYITDDGLDGLEIDLQLSEQIPFGFTGTFTKDVHLLTLTKATGKYLQDLQNQSGAAQDPFAVPIILQSNINGGLGIFGAIVSSKTFTLTAH